MGWGGGREGVLAIVRLIHIFVICSFTFTYCSLLSVKCLCQPSLHRGYIRTVHPLHHMAHSGSGEYSAYCIFHIVKNRFSTPDCSLFLVTQNGICYFLGVILMLIYSVPLIVAENIIVAPPVPSLIYNVSWRNVYSFPNLKWKPLKQKQRVS